MIRRVYRALKRQAGSLPYVLYLATPLLVAALPVEPLLTKEPPRPAPKWLLGHAYKIPTTYSNQESGYFSLVSGNNGRLYIGTAKYGVNAYLVEFNPATSAFAMVLDVHKTIKVSAIGYAAQAKIHTRNNVGASGTIYVGSKQGYPEKGEHRCDYPGGYVLTYNPRTGKCEHYGIAKARHGIISVTPDEARGVAYVSTCSDDRPIDHTHFMVLDLKTRTYRDLGDMEHAYAFIVIDNKGRAYHPVRGGTIARFDPTANKLEKLPVTIDGKPAGRPFTGDQAILNWDISPDRKTLYAVEMSTNGLYSFDLTAAGKTIPGRRLGDILPGAKRTDCRAMCVGPDGTVWAAVTDHSRPGRPWLHLASYKPGTKVPRDHGTVGVGNPNFTKFTEDKGKPRPWHHTMTKAPDGTLSPWVPMGVCALPDGTVYITTIAPHTLIKFTAAQLR
jgi:sugar lactone lactonase YvrE